METTALTIQIGPGTRHSLERLAAEEGIDTATVVEQAVTVWSQLRGERERDLACVDVMEIVFRRLRPVARQEAA